MVIASAPPKPVRSRSRRTSTPALGHVDAGAFVHRLFGDVLHAKRVGSLADGVAGVLQAGCLGIHAIGHGLAAARNLQSKHAVKQVDRLLSNDGVDLEKLLPLWALYVVGDRKSLWINLDWTDFDDMDQTMLVASIQTSHGRSTPLWWKTHTKSALKGQRNAFEDELLSQLKDTLDEGIDVTIVADRGFGDHRLFEFIRDELGWNYLIRFKKCIIVRDSKGESKAAADWFGARGRVVSLRDAAITTERAEVPQVVLIHDHQMEQPWCLASNHRDIPARDLVKAYGRRFTIEEMFRDVKDLRFGMGMAWTPVRSNDRRDRLFLLAALAHGLLTLLGAAGEACGMDKQLKTNTSKKRTLSLFRQGTLWFNALPNMSRERAEPLVAEFGRILKTIPVFSNAFGLL